MSHDTDSSARPTGGAPGLHRFAVLTAVATFVLIFVGGLVTSTGSGLAVPDWPLSFGQVFPPMVGGVLYEHGHRMVAALVGGLSVVLAVWAVRREPRRWVRVMALLALVVVVVQGVLGGLTVLLRLPTAVSVAHACLAQIFFCLVVALAVWTNPQWSAHIVREQQVGRTTLTHLALLTSGAIFGQLMLGALVRHTGSGLAIPDFPLVFGRLLPAAFPAPVLINFLHRVGALVVSVMVLWTAARVWRTHGSTGPLLWPAMLLVGLLVIQVGLGAGIVWSWRAVVPTTAHVAVGAAMLATAVVLTLYAYRLLETPARTTAADWLAERAAA